MDFKTFGEWLRHRRLQLDISPFVMAEALGYKRVSAIYNFEYGVAPLPMAKWPIMARVLGLTMDEFLTVMEQYAPQKVSEFRTIRETLLLKSPALERLKMMSPLSRRVKSERGIPKEGLKVYRTEGAQTIIVFHGSGEEGLPRFVDHLWERGESVGIMEFGSTRLFSGPSAVEHLKQASTIGVLNGEGGPSLASLVKAAFLDALTGVAGYPHIHRVPKIYTCLSEEDPLPLGPEVLEVLLRSLERGSDNRVIRLPGRTILQA
jgi:hypothetical protein